MRCRDRSEDAVWEECARPDDQRWRVAWRASIGQARPRVGHADGTPTECRIERTPDGDGRVSVGQRLTWLRGYKVASDAAFSAIVWIAVTRERYVRVARTWMRRHGVVVLSRLGLKRLLGRAETVAWFVILVVLLCAAGIADAVIGRSALRDAFWEGGPALRVVVRSWMRRRSYRQR